LGACGLCAPRCFCAPAGAWRRAGKGIRAYVRLAAYGYYSMIFFRFLPKFSRNYKKSAQKMQACCGRFANSLHLLPQFIVRRVISDF
jgi:hypothetical protein